MNTQSTNQSQNFSQSQNSDDQADSDPTFSTQLVSTHYQTKKVATPLIILRGLITFLNILNYIREIHNSCIKYIILINFVTGYCRIKSVLLTAEPKT